MASSLFSHLTLLTLRIAFFLGCKRYLHHSLLSNLNQVIQTTTNTSQNKQPSSSDHSPNIELSPTDPSPSPRSSSFIQFLSSKLNPQPHRNSPLTHHHQLISSGLATLIFCGSFSEGTVLFSIVILGSWLDPHARNLNWNLSLALLISSVVFIVPFIECLLFSTRILSRRRKANERVGFFSFRILGLTLIPFGVYLFIYYRLGQIIQGLSGVESGSHSFGFLNTTLARICVPGVILIASLSGGGAVNTAWLTWEWRNREKEPPITDQHITAAVKSLVRAQTDLSERKLILQQHQSHHSNAKPDGSSLLTTLFTGSSNPKTSQLQQEIAGLEALELQMISDLNLLKERKEYQEFSRTILGMILNLANWFLSVYCVYRLFMACVNLVFGYVRQPTTGSDQTTTRSPTTDIVTYLVAKVLSTFNIELEITKLTRLVGLVLIGSIIVVNLRSVLVWVHRVFNRLTLSSSGNGFNSSLMLLVLGQLMAMYLLTCLISLPSSSTRPTKKTGEGATTGSSDELLNTLPSFSRFSKLFDLVFLSTGLLTFFIRWLIKQINLTHQPVHSSSNLLANSSNPVDDSISLNHRLGAHFV